LLNSVIGWPFETGAALARLVFSGIIDRFEVRQCARHRWRVRDAVRGCGHHRIIDVERYGDDVSVPWFGPRLRCERCDHLGADARPNWSKVSRAASPASARWRCVDLKSPPPRWCSPSTRCCSRATWWASG
jgi:hypothetical protein